MAKNVLIYSTCRNAKPIKKLIQTDFQVGP